MRYSVERICQALKLRALLRLYHLVAGARAFTAFSTVRRDALAILKKLARRRALRECVTRELSPLFLSLFSNESPNLLAFALHGYAKRRRGWDRARERQRQRQTEREKERATFSRIKRRRINTNAKRLESRRADAFKGSIL